MMKNIDWQAVASQTLALYPNVIQIAVFSRNRWIIIFEKEPDNYLNTFHPLLKIVRQHKVIIPLIVSRGFIQNSLDSYPLEFLDIQSDYTSLHNVEDILASLQYNKEDIRLQIERELKSKWLLTRLSALQYQQRTGYLYDVLKESFISLLPVFKGFCHLNGVSIPRETTKLLDRLEDILHNEIKVFRFLLAQKKAPSAILLNTLFNDYIRLLNLCADNIDNWKQA